MDRLEYLQRRLDRSMQLIEIGPSHRPIAPKRDGWQTTVVDYTDHTALIAKFAAQATETKQIEEVDVIWNGSDLADLFPPDCLGSYDAILASHVLEHMADPIGFLAAAQRLLKPGGIIVLALPDKRYMFDVFGNLTSTADWLTAHRAKARTHSRRAGFNHVAYHVTNGQCITWDYTARLDDLRLSFNLADGLAHFDANTDGGDGGDYMDYHAWRFTPASFMLLVLESCILCDIDLRVAECTPPALYEFFAVLARGRPAMHDQAQLNELRLDLLRTTVQELRQGTELLRGVV